MGDSARVRWAGVLARTLGATGVLVSTAIMWRHGHASAAGLSLAAGLLGTVALGSAGWHLLRWRGAVEPTFRACGSTLLVDAAGTAFLRSPGGFLIPLDIHQTHCALGVVWIDGRGEGYRYHLLSGADRVGDAQWRQLRAWLKWRSRGGNR